MKQAVKLGALALVSAHLVGCATYIEQRLTQRPHSPEIDMSEMITTFKIEEREFCLPHLEGCTDYFYIAPDHTEKDAPQSWSMSLDLEFNDYTYQVEHKLKRSEVPARNGTVVLLHGYGSDKSAMLLLGQHFRFLGYHVVIPDLAGHGGSLIDTPSYGIHDSVMLNTLVNSLPTREVPQPLHVVGVSMGAVAAAHMVKARTDVTSLMLFAPMRPLDEATQAMAQWSYPTLSRWIPRESFAQGVGAALQKQGATVADTDLRELLAATDIPVLIAASDRDAIGPYEFFLPLESDQVKLVMRPGQHHITTSIPDAELHGYIWEWLQQVE